MVRPEVAPQPVPIEAVPVVLETPPRPTLDVQLSPTAPLVQGVGASLASIANLGGNGRGKGLGDGDGPGAGPGRGGNEGGGPRQIGNGVLPPVLRKRVEPVYTDGAMRARIQGEVHLQAVIRADGTVGELEVIKSLDTRTGLDLEAIRVARQWLFQPATFQGKPVAVYATLILEFRLH
jgi:protein TonB